MATGKKIYWIKLRDTFMESDTVDYLMSQKDGANYIVLYEMLCVKAIGTGGKLSRHIGEMIVPYDVEKIQRETKWFTTDTVRVALSLFKGLGLIYEDVDGSLIIANYAEMVGGETDYSVQKRLQRARKAEIAATEQKSLTGETQVTEAQNDGEKRNMRRYVEENLLKMSSGNWECLRELMEDGITDEMVMYAVDLALANGNRRWSYVEGIISNWIVEGVHTLDQAKEHKNKGKRANDNGNQGITAAETVEVKQKELPDAFKRLVDR